ncbi:MAG: serine dehydratase subunit alpha family protein [Clostridia bacterium]|nr:serine dehydratase subunit alpha family protein [Clostridia bacterium]
MDQQRINSYIDLLKRELIPAMGCTEPIALAYASALAACALGETPESVEVFVSYNIIKNVKSVVVPSTGGAKGIESAVVAGIVSARPDRKLQVLSVLTEVDLPKIHALLAENIVKITPVEGIFEIGIRMNGKGHTAYAHISEFHTNVVKLERDGVSLPLKSTSCTPRQEKKDEFLTSITVREILEFADNVDLSLVAPILDRQIECNMAIAEEGIRGDFGANVGKTILSVYGNDVKIKAKAYAAAGSDARMNGCELPVIINSGSGNQGITASVPVIVYARECGLSKEKLYRALLVSNLCTLHLKAGIGRLSAYCGAVSAGCASGAGIAYLLGGGFLEVAHTLVNALAIASGIVCDGAKASCAGKIAAAVDAGLLGYFMILKGNQFYGGDGIVKKGVENTIDTVGKLARLGMSETDKEIIRLMLG